MKLKRFIVIIALLFISFLAVFIWDFYSYANKPANDDKTEHVIIVKSGQDLSATAIKFYEAGIITDSLKFKLLVRLKNYGKKIQAGEYLLSPAMSPNKILDIIVSGRVILHKLTIPEGYNIYQIASIIETAGLGMGNSFVSAAKNRSLVRYMNIEADTFEGYLFPDTYHFPNEISPKKMIATMARRFRNVFIPEWEKRAKELGFSIHQIVTLASIIEKETGASSERSIISSVFHNRLKKGMRLESDPTVIYGIKDFDGNITRKHLAANTPYNTYRISGLPAGPIANPGKEAIKATLFPADTSYVYFVSKKDNTHKFSTNMADHNRAVRKYQILKR